MYRAMVRSWPWLGVVARLVVGGVWLLAGALKLADPAVSVRAVRAYDLLPESIVPTVGRGLPALEICVGVLLVAGLATRVAALISCVLLIAFIIGISSAWARGLQIDCGCFGGGGLTTDATSKYPWEIARDVGLLLLSGLLALSPSTYLSFDRIVFAERIDPDGQAG